MSSGTQCVFCEDLNSETLYLTKDIFDNEYSVAHCRSCKAYFLSPRPSTAILSLAYGTSYYGENSEKFNPIVEKVLDRFRGRRAKHLSRYIQNKARILDVGCGNGRFLHYLLRFGNYELYGIELPGNSACRAARIPHIKLKVGSLESTDFVPHTFDAITLFHVFEHLPNPMATLQTISKIIKPHGTLIMSFPNIDSIQSHLFKGKWLHLDPPRHLFFLAPRDFVRVMQSYGFELISQRYASIEQNPFGMIQSILNLICTRRDVLLERLKGNYYYAQEYSHVSILFQMLFAAVTFPVFVMTDLVAATLKKGATVEFTFAKKRASLTES
jgi:2-polyprenyl-3-methyl-5-hydroxy-6-metoxy-1,4-benzoquinol methylase